jgi:hypothetical protein
MFWSLFEKMGLGSKDLIPHKGSLIGFTGDTIIPKGYVDLKVCFGKKPSAKTIPARFIGVDCPSAYNTIIGQPTLNRPWRHSFHHPSSYEVPGRKQISGNSPREKQ